MPLTMGMLGAQSLGPADPNYSSVVRLFHGDGTNLSTTITDNSSFARTVARAGDTSIRTATKKFGTGSIFFDGTGDYWTDDQTEVGMTSAQEFTFECWFNFSGTTETRYIACFGDSTSNGRYLFGVNSGLVFCQAQFNGTFYLTYQGFSSNTWYHFAGILNSARLMKGYLNGAVFTAQASITVPAFSTNAKLTVGATDQGRNTTSTSQWLGYLDDIRFTKGVNRYPLAFTAPTQPFPNH